MRGSVAELREYGVRRFVNGGVADSFGDDRGGARCERVVERLEFAEVSTCEEEYLRDVGVGDGSEVSRFRFGELCGEYFERCSLVVESREVRVGVDGGGFSFDGVDAGVVGAAGEPDIDGFGLGRVVGEDASGAVGVALRGVRRDGVAGCETADDSRPD